MPIRRLANDPLEDREQPRVYNKATQLRTCDLALLLLLSVILGLLAASGRPALYSAAGFFPDLW